MATQTSSRTAEYKGRTYRLLYLGETKYGVRAHLQFFDGSKDFWCDGSLVREGRADDSHGNQIGNGESYRAGVTAPRGRRCPMCGSRECARAWDQRDLCDED